MTGFLDGEGNFLITIKKKANLKTGWAVELSFSVRLHEKDMDLLRDLQIYFDDIGRIYHHTKVKQATFTVYTIKEIETIIAHFEKYPLKSKKYTDFVLFKRAYLLVKNKEHLTNEGVLKLANIKASMNTKIMVDIPGIVPVELPVLDEITMLEPDWISGFTSAEGCFTVSIKKSKGSLGMTSFMRFILTQHSRDHNLMILLQNYFGCGKINCGGDATYLVVQKLSCLTDIIIPFFDKYRLNGNKVKDFEDFKLIAQLMNSKAHTTKNGIDKIKEIKNRMNSYRINE